MRKLVCVLASALCIGVPAAQAVAAGAAEFSLNYNKSFTEWSGSGELGGGIGVGLAYWRTASPDLSYGFEASYDDLGKIEYTYNDPQAGGTPVDVRLDAKVLRFNPAFRVRFGPPEGANFIAQVGAGLYNVTWNFRYAASIIFQGEDSETKLAFNAGAGAGLPLGGSKRLNLLVAYHVVPGEEAFADDFNYVQFRASLGIPL